MKQEVLRYLGYNNQLPDEKTSVLVDSCLEEIAGLAEVRSTHRFYEIKKAEGYLALKGTNLILAGTDITRHLAHSSVCLLMAVTLGHKVDCKIRYYQKTDFSRALVLDACATAAIEEACNNVVQDLAQDLLKAGQKLTTRYSPGYGDFPLEIQSRFVETIEADRSIGLTVTSASILIPRKSVTAVAGVIDLDQDLTPPTCLDCRQYGQCHYSKGVE